MNAATNRRAFLDMIASSEIGAKLLAKSDNGYNVMVGGKLFDSYRDHPRVLTTVTIKGKEVKSTAAGRYQLLARYWDAYRKQLRLPDFSPASQDAVALQQIREQRALPLVDAGHFDDAVHLCANIWASLPGAGYGQHENDLVDLRKAFVAAGGVLA